MDKLGYLRCSLSFILAFVGFKMIVEGFDVHLSQEVSLGVIGGALAVGVGTSLVLAPKTAKRKTVKEDYASDDAVGHSAAKDAVIPSPSDHDGGDKAKNH